ncbi:MAG: SUMF1/EgtB/PvdO family nonheme iron enzyme [Chloroflexi bacterium]|nr:SUMF1/EgtB/PvdO family nonheme iron enzyme [Chloroflexota bacterium]
MQLLLLGLFFLALPASGQQRGLKVVTRTPEGVLDLYDNSWAVVIGIDQYQKWPALQYAVKDARAVQDKLIGLGFPPANILFLADAQATKTRIELILGDELRRKVGENDRVFLYFAGHGQTEDLPGGKQEGYIVPVDGDKANLFSTCISMTSVRQFSERLAAKHVFYAIDACYSGLAFMRAGELDNQDQQYLRKVARFPARQLVTAGSAGEQVVEQGGHGAFTRNLLLALDGNADKYPPFGVLTGSELGAYLKPTVSLETNNAQTPQFGRLSGGEGEFLFVLSGADGTSASQTNQYQNQSKQYEDQIEKLKAQIEAEKRRQATEDSARAEAQRKQREAEALQQQLEALKRQQTQQQPQGKSSSTSSGGGGGEMVLVPAGEFVMGSNDEVRDEKPAHRLYLDAFFIDQYEVTNAQWNAYARATGKSTKSEPDDHPVVNATWGDARDYCQWAGKRLPTEAEWEKAARGTDRRTYPWGEGVDESKAHYGSGGTKPVGSYPAGVSPYGAYDMAGNVWEWVADWYDGKYYAQSPSRNPAGPSNGSARSIRGGSWADDTSYLSASGRDYGNPTSTFVSLGFRCAQD